MVYCVDCKHWDQNQQKGVDGRHDFEFGRCRMVEQFEDAYVWSVEVGDRVLLKEHKNQLAFVQDSYIYGANLITRPTFGCVCGRRKVNNKG